MSNRVSAERRWDRTVRSVMWVDAFLSTAAVVVSVLAVPVVAVLGLPHRVMGAVAGTALVCALLLAACGAVTAAALVARMRRGQYLLPSDLKLPLPPGLKPTLVTQRPAP